MLRRSPQQARVIALDVAAVETGRVGVNLATLATANRFAGLGIGTVGHGVKPYSAHAAI